MILGIILKLPTLICSALLRTSGGKFGIRRLVGIEIFCIEGTNLAVLSNRQVQWQLQQVFLLQYS